MEKEREREKEERGVLLQFVSKAFILYQYQEEEEKEEGKAVWARRARPVMVPVRWLEAATVQERSVPWWDAGMIVKSGTSQKMRLTLELLALAPASRWWSMLCSLYNWVSARASVFCLADSTAS